MILIQANNVARRFGDTILYENINFNIQTGDRVALVGRNGVGKSTLIQQIMGLEPISEGEITAARDITIGYLEQHVALDSDRTIWQEMIHVFQDTLALRNQAEVAAQRVAELSENWDSPEYKKALEVYDRLQSQLQEKNAYGVESEIRTVLHGFRFYEEDYDKPVQSLSGGQQTRLALAKTLLMQYDLLILDEPTNHLDMETLTWLEGYLRGYRGALLIVSHDRYFLNRISNSVIEIRHRTAHIYKGNYDYYLKEKEARLQQEWKQYEKQQVEIAKLEDFVARNLVRASTTKRAQSRRKKLEKMDRIDKPKSDAKAPRIQFSGDRTSGDRVVEAQNLAVGYDQDEGPIAEDINIDVRRQEAIAVVGPNGVGKSTFLKTLIGELKPLAGEVMIGTKVDMGYYSQNVNHLDGNVTVLETLWRAHDNTDEGQIRSILGSFLFSGETVEKKVSLLSGGEKARLSLALLATNHDNTLLLDEPTNHLDIDSKEVLEEALIDFDGTLIFVSHDRYFINRIATSVLEISPESATLYHGDYDYYIDKKAELEAFAQEMAVSNGETTPAGAEGKVKNKDKVGATSEISFEQSKALKRELRNIVQGIKDSEDELEKLEAANDKLHEDLIVASNKNDQAQLHDLHEALLANQAKSDELMNRWEELSLALEDFQEQYPDIEI